VQTDTARLTPAAPLALFAVTAPGLEPLAAAELAALGIRGVPEPGGVAWTGPLADAYAANLELRTASRVLARVGDFRARTFFELERHARRLPWARFLAPGRAVRLRVSCRKSKLYHEGAVAQRFLEAIEHTVGATGAFEKGHDDAADEAPERTPDAGTQGDAQLFVIRFLHDRCTVSADTSGALLHQRGYRQAVAKAPLRETLAAAMLRASGWDGAAPLIDPMCGSGTIAIEAALLARRIAPGLASASREARRYALLEWPEHDPAEWERVVERARERIRPAAGAPILASDRDAGAIEAARANAERAGVLDDIDFAVRPLSAIEPPAGVSVPGWLITNPPYGVRVGESRALRDLYAALGRTARQKLPGWTLALLSADRALERQIGIPLTTALQTRNGGIAVRIEVGRVKSEG
jgi:putative N6-adenine-specific DNA methylase